MPAQVCLTCEDIVNTMFKFKKLCEDSEALLKKMADPNSSVGMSDIIEVCFTKHDYRGVAMLWLL